MVFPFLLILDIGGKRQRKLDEPMVDANQEDFMLAEMTNMAIDF